MPHDALNAAPLVGGRRPEVILGDRFGAACERWLIDAAAELFAAEGFAVARNAPFAGGYITQTYGQPQVAAMISTQSTRSGGSTCCTTTRRRSTPT